MILPSNHCFTIPTPVARISVWKRFANISYQLPSLSLDNVTNVSPRTHSEAVGCDTYFGLYDRLFPQGEGDDLQRTLLTQVTAYMAAERRGPGEKMSEGRMELYFLPWLLQQSVSDQWWPIYKNNVPKDNRITAMFCKSVYRVQLAAHSFYIYSAFSLFTLGWCLVQLCYILPNRIPMLSAFPDLDLAEKVGRNEMGVNAGDNIFSKLANLSSTEIITNLAETRMYVRSASQTEPGAMEMGRFRRRRMWQM